MVLTDRTKLSLCQLLDLISDSKLSVLLKKHNIFIYTFISKGAHRPLGFTDEEFVRFGINLAISACYFLVKILNGDEGS